MKKRFAALCLTCSALLSLSAPAAAVRAPNDSGQPQSSTGNTSVTIPSDGTLSFDQIGPRVKANNLTLKAAQESLKSAEAMDWDEAIDEMEDAIDDMDLYACEQRGRRISKCKEKFRAYSKTNSHN